jgi:hypothetical protein
MQAQWRCRDAQLLIYRQNVIAHGQELFAGVNTTPANIRN